MDNQEILALFDRQMRRDVEYPGMRKDIFPWGVRFVRPAPGISFIADYRLDEEIAGLVIQEQIDYFRQLNQSFTWKVYEHDRLTSIKESLLSAGFESEEQGILMVFDLQEMSIELQSPTRLDIRLVTRRDKLGDVIQVLESVWGGNFGWVWQRLGDHLEVLGHLSIYVGYVDDQPASVGWIYYHPGSQFGSLFGGSTLVEKRGRGLYSAILARRAQEALARGMRFLAVETTEMSRPIVARHGFRRLSSVQDFEWRPG